MGEVADTWFLLVQHRRANRTDVTTFDDLSQATAAYDEAERRYKDEIHGSHGDVDVLLVGASSEEVVRTRYPSYFTNVRTRSAKLQKLMSGLPVALAH